MLNHSALPPGVSSFGDADGTARYTAACQSAFRRKYFLDLNIGISCACLEPLVYFNLMNLWSVMLTDHDSMLAIEYLTTCISLSFFMLLYFVYHCKLPYILLDIGDDEWLEVHFERRLRILSLQLGGKEPWFWEKLPASLALYNYDSHFSILLAMALLLLLILGVPTGADRGWRSNISLKFQPWLMQSMWQLGRWIDEIRQTIHTLTTTHLESETSHLHLKNEDENSAYFLEPGGLGRIIFTYKVHSTKLVHITLWKS